MSVLIQVKQSKRSRDPLSSQSGAPGTKKSRGAEINRHGEEERYAPARQAWSDSIAPTNHDFDSGGGEKIGGTIFNADKI